MEYWQWSDSTVSFRQWAGTPAPAVAVSGRRGMLYLAPPPSAEEDTLKPGYGTKIFGKLVLVLIYAVFCFPLLGSPMLFLLTSLGRHPFRLRILLQVFLPSSLLSKAMKLLAHLVHDLLWSILIMCYLLGGYFLDISFEVVMFFTTLHEEQYYSTVLNTRPTYTKRLSRPASRSIQTTWFILQWCIAVAHAERSKYKATKILAFVSTVGWAAGVLLLLLLLGLVCFWLQFLQLFYLVLIPFGVVFFTNFLQRCCCCCNGSLFKRWRRDRKRRKKYY